MHVLVYICRLTRARPKRASHCSGHGMWPAASVSVPVVQERRSLRDRSAQAEQPNDLLTKLRAQLADLEL